MGGKRHGVVTTSLLAAVVVVATLTGIATPAQASGPRVWRVGRWHGRSGDFATIQAAVDAAHPGDWILVAPGDYHERGDSSHPGPNGEDGAGVLITKPGIHLRGLDRNKVIVDGTKVGSKPCDPSPAAQELGPVDANGKHAGRNGIEVFEADGVTIENLTVCNFLDGAHGGGNQIWWNGGDGTGTVNLGAFHGEYLSATSTYYGGPGAPAASYGIFVSNARGPGSIVHTYASNMDDSSYYIGACPDCNAALLDAHAQNSALGYSGTNSGGHLVIAFSEWDGNKTGISTNSQNNDDAPSPQNGACPGGATGPLGTPSCTFFAFNDIHDNNNPNVPGSGSAALGPPGTGMVLAGGRNDTIFANRVVHNGSWGLLVVPFPDRETPPPISHCEGGSIVLGLCYYDPFGNDVRNNLLSGNGFFGNASNGDLAEISNPETPGNCWHGNVDPAGVTSAPANLQVTHARCGVPNQGADLSSDLASQVICATEVFGSCPDAPGHHYPRTTQVRMLALVRQHDMPDPCRGVPDGTCDRDEHDGH